MIFPSGYDLCDLRHGNDWLAEKQDTDLWEAERIATMNAQEYLAASAQRLTDWQDARLSVPFNPRPQPAETEPEPQAPSAVSAPASFPPAAPRLWTGPFLKRRL
jgi:hypothetical protein